MAEQTITNPNGAYLSVSDWRTGKDTAGALLPYPAHDEELMEASAAIAVGKVVCLASAASATVKPRIAAATASTGVRNVGVLTKASTAAGDVRPVTTRGPALAVAGGAITANDTLSVDANGKVVSESLDATDVNSRIIGWAMQTAAAEDDVVLIYVAPR